MSPGPDAERRAILETVERYYTAKFQEFGATPKGVDWNSAESQETRFAQLLKLVDPMRPFTIIDYGCGYGALADYLRQQHRCDYQYVGYELSAPMRAEAARRHSLDPKCSFHGPGATLDPADYVVASGIFNVKEEIPSESWERYVLATIDVMAAMAGRGFAFNVLSSYSDPDRRRATLYYADPCALFDYCKRRHSRDVALLHDYGLYEFTVIVRKDT